MVGRLLKESLVCIMKLTALTANAGFESHSFHGSWPLRSTQEFGDMIMVVLGTLTQQAKLQVQSSVLPATKSPNISSASVEAF